jgi:hypothetical protein
VKFKPGISDCVKFGKDVAGSVVKVPEKFGFNWSIFGWFGISPSTWRAGN